MYFSGVQQQNFPSFFVKLNHRCFYKTLRHGCLIDMKIKAYHRGCIGEALNEHRSQGWVKKLRIPSSPNRTCVLKAITRRSRAIHLSISQLSSLNRTPPPCSRAAHELLPALPMTTVSRALGSAFAGFTRAPAAAQTATTLPSPCGSSALLQHWRWSRASRARRFSSGRAARISMSLRAGIVGLPNVGKSTLFNAIVSN